MGSEEIRNIIQEKLREYRKSRGWTQAELGKLLGKTQTAISEIEVGRNSVSIEDMTKLLELFNITFDEFLDTRKTSIYLSEYIDEKLNLYVKELDDIFPAKFTDYDKKVVIANQLLKLILEGNIRVDIKEILKNEIKKLSVI